MSGAKILLPLTALLCGIYTLIEPETELAKHPLAQPSTVPLKSGDISTQATHLWNFLAPLANDVSDRVSRKDFSVVERIPEDLRETARSILLHEARPTPGNITVMKCLFQVVLFVTCAVILKLYVVPLF
jgi:hypothetical protein